MNINESFVSKSKHLKGTDIPEEGVTVVIDRVEIEDMPDGSRKPAIYFKGKNKGLILNVTNSKKITQLLGTFETDNWNGRPIVLYQTETTYEGDLVPCIRIRGAKNGQAQEKPKPAPVVEMDDSDIPF